MMSGQRSHTNLMSIKLKKELSLAPKLLDLKLSLLIRHFGKAVLIKSCDLKLKQQTNLVSVRPPRFLQPWRLQPSSKGREGRTRASVSTRGSNPVR